MVKIAAVSGNVVTLVSPLSVAFKVANGAQLTPWNSSISTMTQGIGIEEMYLYGGGNGGGNVSVDLCDGCWIRHIESHWFNGASVSFRSCYHCELRDSYLHEASDYKILTNGGGGYLHAIDKATANSLVENNVIWNGDKVIVMRASGGGNVVGYNYFDDSWDVGAPVAQEAGVNAGHYLGSHMELMDGNWSHKYSGDSWWGNTLYITALRDQFSRRRSGQSWLATLVNGNGYPYCDCWARSALTMQNFQWWHNIVGNILGYNGQTLLNGQMWPPSTFMATQNHTRYESPDALSDDSAITMYEIGVTQDGSGFPTDPNMYQR